MTRSPDLLFGSCQNVFSRALHGEPRFTLTHREIRQLERQITALIQAGFTWKDAFTQCILQNTLVSFARSSSPSARSYQQHRLCEDALGVAGSWRDKVPVEQEEDATEAAINSEIASILLRLLASAENLDAEENEEVESGIPSISSHPEGAIVERRDRQPSSKFMQQLLSSSQKRDEIVQVHKYFDKSKGTWKRDPYYNRYLQESEPGSDSDQYSLPYPGYESGDTPDNAPGYFKDGGNSYLYLNSLDFDDKPSLVEEEPVTWNSEKSDVGGDDGDALADDFLREAMAESNQLPVEPNLQTGRLTVTNRKFEFSRVDCCLFLLTIKG